MLRERGMFAEYTMDDYRDLFCFPVKDYYLRLGYTFEDETYEQISVEFNELYDMGFNQCGLIDGVLDKLKESKEKGYRNVILSACEHQKLLAQTEQLGIADYFEERLGIDNIHAASKVEMAKEWMTKSDVKPEDCIFIGDTLHDMETALAIGVTNYILVACGHQSERILKENTDRVVSSMKEVMI
jgi:phosphoglycolate phosphatase